MTIEKINQLNEKLEELKKIQDDIESVERMYNNNITISSLRIDTILRLNSEDSRYILDKIVERMKVKESELKTWIEKQ